MTPRRLTVFLPCHSLADLQRTHAPGEAESLLAAWTAVWHPAILQACGVIPDWASIFQGLPDGVRLGVVPTAWDGSFPGVSRRHDPAEASADTGSGDRQAVRLIRGHESAAAIAAEAYRRLAAVAEEPGDHPHEPTALLPGDDHAEDFRAVGLAVLLAELTARRMRTDAGLEATGFSELVLEAARAAVAGADRTVQERLAEAFSCLEASRARYYPVDTWVVDAVLLAGAVDGESALDDLGSPVPLAVVATGDTLHALAESRPTLIRRLRSAVAEGRIELCGGRAEDAPLDSLSPESILESFERGRAAWNHHAGSVPTCQAAISGGSSALLPQILTGLGYRAAVWSLCDGSPLPDPGGGRILWEGTGGESIGAAARTPLDSSQSGSVLAIPDALGDAMDHDHVAVLQFAGYAGCTSPWHRLVRRIGRWSTLLGRFVTPSAFVEQSAESAASAWFGPDAFPSAVPVDRAGMAASAAAIRAEAERLVAAASGWRPLLPRSAPAAVVRPSGSPRRAIPFLGGWVGPRPPALLRLDNGVLSVEAHPRSGGLLSVRRPADRGNRLSQQLALRTTPPGRPGGDETAAERAVFTRMEADRVEREGDAETGRLVAHGRLVGESGRPAGRFTQRVTLAPGLPLALLDVEVTIDGPQEGPPFEAYVACRFAWHENEEVALRRSLHLQAIETERTRFVAPHFVGLSRPGSQEPSDEVVILTAGLPWHHRSSPHVLDSILVGTGDSFAVRLGVAVGLERPWEAALALAAGRLPEQGPKLPGNVRITGIVAGGPGAARQTVGLIESLGRAGEVGIEWARPVGRATPVDLQGRPIPNVHVAVEGRSTVVFLHRYQWLHLDVEFADADRPPAAGREGPA